MQGKPRQMGAFRLALAMVAVGCAVAPAHRTQVTGSVERSIRAAADEAGVPRDLLVAIAVEEGGLALPAERIVDPDDNVPVGGVLELRHGKLNTLALGAQLMGTTEDALRGDTELGTRAGAHVVAWRGARYSVDAHALASWRPALAALSGMDDDNAQAYASRVLAILRAGGAFPAGGETVALAAHPEIDPSEGVAPAAKTPLDTPDFPGAIWFTTSCTNKCDVGRPLGNASVDKIVIHDTEGGWDGSVATLQNDAGKSVHYIVDSDGSRVGQFRPETDTTWHAGNYYYNETSIGIEHVGYAAQTYSDGLYNESRKLVKNIRTRWTIPLDRTHIVGHYQVPNGNDMAESSAPCADTLENCENSADYGGADNHRDPGFNWQWCQYMQKLGGSCACSDAWPLWNCTTDLTEAVRCSDGQVQIEACTGPAGCTVMPVGQDDVCDTSGGSGSAIGPIQGSASSYGGGDDDDGGGTTGKHAGCAAGGGGAGLVLALAIALPLRRRRSPGCSSPRR